MGQRKLLDSLMGKDRNGDTEITTKHFTDEDVCKNYLCGLCPHDLFRNTKMDDGECSLKHSDVLRQDYDAAVKKGERFPYERDLMITLEGIVQDCNRKIDRAKQRIQNTPGDQETASKAAAVQALYAKAMELGEEGKIQESEELLLKAEEMKNEQEDEDSKSGTTQQEKLRVCEICSAFLSIYDSNRRLADHFGGKLHIGYLQVRERLDSLKEKYPPGSNRTFTERGRGSPPPRDRRRDRSPEYRRPRSRDYPPRDYDRPRDDRRRGSRDDRGRRDSRGRDYDRPRDDRRRGSRDDRRDSRG